MKSIFTRRTPRIALIVAILGCPALVWAQANEADKKVAREVMYCGLFKIKSARMTERPEAVEATKKKTFEFVQVAMLGLNIKDAKALAQDVETQIAAEANAVRAKNGDDPAALKQFLAERGARCGPFMKGQGMAAYKRGLAAIEKYQSSNPNNTVKPPSSEATPAK